MAKNESDLFRVQSHTSYFSWVSLKGEIPAEAVEFTDSRGKVHIGRVQRNDHIIPGALRNGVCRFLFEGKWQEERTNIEVMKDNFGAARTALSWQDVAVENDGHTVLSLNSEIGGVLPDGGLYLIGRHKVTLDIVPIEIKSEDRNFERWHIEYRGKPLTDVEVLSSKYHQILAICPQPPAFDD